ncbi:MAG TPA: hypothetical protein ENK54_07045 [Thiotrichales bacterium]|nr:hypothetical protein [Thiotrichales bacterium]
MSVLLSTVCWGSTDRAPAPAQAEEPLGTQVTVRLADYFYPLQTGNQWVFSVRDPFGSWVETLSVGTRVPLFAGSEPLGEAYQLYGVADGGFWSDTWNDYWDLSAIGELESYGFDATGMEVRFSPPMTMPAQMAFGPVYTTVARTFLDGLDTGYQATWKIRLLGLTRLTVPAGTFDDVLVLGLFTDILAERDLAIFWLARGVGLVKSVSLTDSKSRVLSSYSVNGP